MWDRFKEILADLLIIGFGCFFTWVFIHILIYGSMWIGEQNPIILWVEAIGAPLVVLLGIGRLIKDL